MLSLIQALGHIVSRYQSEFNVRIMKRNIWLFFSMVFLFGACSDFLNMPPKNTKVVYTISDVRDAMSTLLFATTSSSYHSGGTISNSVRFNDE